MRKLEQKQILSHNVESANKSTEVAATKYMNLNTQKLTLRLSVNTCISLNYRYAGYDFFPQVKVLEPLANICLDNRNNFHVLYSQIPLFFLLFLYSPRASSSSFLLFLPEYEI